MFQVQVSAVFADAGGDYPDEVSFTLTETQRIGPSPTLDNVIAHARKQAREEIPESGLRLRAMTIELVEFF